ncbi:MAG: cysteine methyltransferase [Candidatus Riflebacteria bacterium HGW-Riflebacteria-2]|jgi:methylated-DNA-[protein]-cysteine S-methyltransferase|nr:MAG: cysteine methyltransferase [Candidatus Riflebacteria bacterium HGW-Riflebacteria-2]
MTTKKKTTKVQNESGFYCTFATEFGPAAIAWRQSGIVALLLPETSQACLKRRIKQNFADYCETQPSLPVGKAIKQIQLYFAGQPSNFKSISIDLTECTPFCRTVYEQLRQVTAGATTSYKNLATACDKPAAARAIGLAAGKNPVPLLIPCHRVVNADGRLGGFSAGGGIPLKARMLRLEGHAIEEKPVWRVRPPLLISDCNLDAVLRHLSRADSDLGDLIRVAPRFNLEFNPDTSIFQALLEAIVFQQLTGKAAATIYRRVLALFSGKTSVTALDIIRADEDELRSAGLSQNKVLAIKDLANFAVSGKLPDHDQMRLMSNAEIISRLTHIRGIGRWTVEMLLIFKLGRADVMAADDYGLRKGLAAIRHSKELPTPSELTRQAEAWQPYRSVASWYLWRAAENYRID